MRRHRESIGAKIAGICYSGVTTDYPKWSITQVVQVGVSAHIARGTTCLSPAARENSPAKLKGTRRTQHFACHVLRAQKCVLLFAFCMCVYIDAW